MIPSFTRKRLNRSYVIACVIIKKPVHAIFGVLKSGKMQDPDCKPVFA